MEALLPAKSRAAAALLNVFRHAARTTGPRRDAWHAHLADLYGDLSGQRALARDPAFRHFENDHPYDLIQALQCYFVLAADLVAVARLRRGDVLSSLPFGKLQAFLASLSTGRAWKKLGILASISGVPFDGYLEHLTPRDEDAVRALVNATETLAGDEWEPGCDVMQPLYARLMPRNLLHATGEFYTPAWLAELLLDDSGWQPGQTLLDPFAGSGVFLLAALARASRSPLRVRLARRDRESSNKIDGPGSRLRLRAHAARREREAASGSSIRSLLPQLGAIDRNPVACVAARTNLILHIAGHRGDEYVRLPILCSDSLLSDDSPLPAPADVLLTNPPWVGWEYLPRAYRARLTGEWARYGLYTARGRDAAFLKEDLSTLALVSVWDRFLKEGGTSAVVLRPAAMQSHLAGRGLRRLSLRPDAQPLELQRIRLFPGLRLFGAAQAPGAAWCLTRPGEVRLLRECDRLAERVGHNGSTPRNGAVARMLVRTIEWQPRAGWQPPANASLSLVRENITERELAATRSDPADLGSAWTIGPADSLRAAAALAGRNAYRVRTGVFTGGGNGVYYLERLGPGSAAGRGRYRNCPEGARRHTPATECDLEDALVYDVVRGRDLSLWRAMPGASILCPHTAETRMQAISLPRLRRDYPAAMRYLKLMRPILDARQGFSGWERKQRESAFYALQRIGDYTFQRYKVAWRYIATDFVVAVIGPARDGRSRLGNDKVMFIACASPGEAFFLCGLLSSSPVRWCVTATMTGTQISASAIRHLALPAYDAGDARHRRIAERCRQGHAFVRTGAADSAQAALDDIDGCVAEIYELSPKQMRTFDTGPRFHTP